MNDSHRVTSFRNQRVWITFGFFLLVFSATTAVLWNHIGNVMGDGVYSYLARFGLLMVPFVGLVVTCWELFVDDTTVKRVHKSHSTVIRLVNWCFFASWALLILDVVHMGALLKYEQSSKQQESAVKMIGEQQARIASETTKAAIESSGKVAQEMNATGQRQSARRTIEAGKGIATNASTAAQKNIADAAEKATPSTFLPSSYTNGGMYLALPLAAVLILMITMFLARSAAPHVDRDDDGKPDAEQKKDKKKEALDTPLPVGDTGTLYSFTPDGKLVEVTPDVSEAEARRRATVDAVREQAEARQKPVVTWRGGRIVDGEKERGN